jgi:hypothetical protein
MTPRELITRIDGEVSRPPWSLVTFLIGVILTMAITWGAHGVTKDHLNETMSTHAQVTAEQMKAINIRLDLMMENQRDVIDRINAVQMSVTTVSARQGRNANTLAGR